MNGGLNNADYKEILTRGWGQVKKVVSSHLN